jgi:hypothetical protein
VDKDALKPSVEGFAADSSSVFDFSLFPSVDTFGHVLPVERDDLGDDFRV